MEGLSPRVRGNRYYPDGDDDVPWSIPACAGEPWVKPRAMRCETVYPRVCGGTRRGLIRRGGIRGLSPRVRGNRREPAPASRRGGSIPACAGEPVAVRPPTWGGLSPRVRGNRRGWTCISARHGSIPACAGEPCGFGLGLAAGVVYPRVCGGTRAGGGFRTRLHGLSPRVRGNRPPSAPRAVRTRSIPACAGEPVIGLAGTGATGVYPRVCGGTRCLTCYIPTAGGLSPRVRGNPVWRRQRIQRRRSIPACAGEPIPCAFSAADAQVYPRVCGGTPPQ